jgi:hypothetical protein
LAIVNQSPRLNVAVSMKARSLGTKKVQVFQDIPSAARWLATRPKEDKGKPKDEPTTGTAKRSAG